MPELGASGSVRGALRNERPYRERYTCDCIFVGEDTDDIGTALDLAIETFEWVD